MGKIIFCEGKNDFAIINKILGNIQGQGVILLPTNGKTNMKHFVQARATGGKKNIVQGEFFTIRDRDCDFSNTIEKELLGQSEKTIAGAVSAQKIDAFQEKEQEGEQKIIKSVSIPYQEFVLKRICIENYFLDFDAIVQFNQGKVKGLDSYQKCKGIFDQAAKDLTNYAAIRHALGLCKKNLWNDIRLETSLAKSKQLPKNLDTETLLQKIRDNISAYRDAVDKDATCEYFEKKYKHFLKLFEQPTFIQKSCYLEFFSASDLQNQVGAILLKNGIHFSFDEFYEYQIENFEFKKFPDWVEFVDLLKS